MSHVAVSTWSLHRSLGQPAPYGPERVGALGASPTHPAQFSLLELPAHIAAAGLHSLDLCHFHLPVCDDGYLAELRTALKRAGVTLWTLLVDAGDITHPANGGRDREWISRWVPHAGALGATTIRVIAGKSQPNAQTLQASLHGLRSLATLAKTHGVRLIIENWFSTTSRPEQVFWLLEQMDGQLGLKLDFGNWSGATKYQDLASIAPFAESCHAKAQFNGPYKIDDVDFERCLEITRAAGFDGPYTLIYDDPAGMDEWRGLQIEKEIVERHL